MRIGRLRIKISAGFYISVALSLCILPFKWFAGWLLAIIIHELSHCAAVLACGSSVREIRLTAFGAEIIADIKNAKWEVICSLAGPIGGFLLVLFYKTIPIAALCAIVHSARNLLPLKNLDGGWALFSLLRMFFNEVKAREIRNMTDRIVRILLFVAVLFIAYWLRWWSLAILGAIVLLRKQGNIKYTCKRKKLQVQYVH